MKQKQKTALIAYIFILPQIIGMLCFILGPMVASLVISFSRWNLVDPPQWVGFENFRIQFHDPLFWKVLLNTVYYSFASVPLGIVISLGLALVLNQKIKGVTWYRSVYFAPVVTPMVAVALVWSWLYNPDFGAINTVLNYVGIKGPKWLADTTWAMPSVIIMSIWKSLGFNMVILLAGLQDIPEQLYEVAGLDGADRWHKFKNITLPMLSPAIFFVMIISVISSFQVFSQIYIMTGGGPANSTNVIVLHIYDLAFRYWKMGEGSVVGWVLFAIILLFTSIQFGLSKRWVYYER